MVYGTYTSYNYSYWGESKLTNITTGGLTLYKSWDFGRKRPGTFRELLDSEPGRSLQGFVGEASWRP